MKKPFSRSREKVPKADEGASEASCFCLAVSRGNKIKSTLAALTPPHPALRATFSR